MIIENNRKTQDNWFNNEGFVSEGVVMVDTQDCAFIDLERTKKERDCELYFEKNVASRFDAGVCWFHVK